MVVLVLSSPLALSPAVRADDELPQYEREPVKVVARPDTSNVTLSIEGVGNAAVQNGEPSDPALGGALRLRIQGAKDTKKVYLQYKRDSDYQIARDAHGNPIVESRDDDYYNHEDLPPGIDGSLEASLGKVGSRMIGSATGKLGYRLTSDARLGGRWGVEYDASFSRHLGTANMDLVLKNRDGQGATTFRLAPLGVFAKRATGGTFGGYSGLGIRTEQSLFDAISLYAGVDAGILWGIHRDEDIRNTQTVTTIPGETTQTTETGPNSQTTTTTTTSTVIVKDTSTLVQSGIDQFGSGSLLSARAGLTMRLGQNLAVGVHGVAERMDYKTQETLLDGSKDAPKSEKEFNVTTMVDAAMAF